MTRLLPLILAVLLLPVAGSVTESRLASVAVGPSEGASWSAPARTISATRHDAGYRQGTGSPPALPGPFVADSNDPDFEMGSGAVGDRHQSAASGIQARTSGEASWFCKAGTSACHHAYPDRPGKLDYYAAAGPKVRRMFAGDWRGKTVIVSANGRSIVVKLIDWCGHRTRLLDLYADAFVRLARLDQGVVNVTISSRTSAIGRPLSRDKPSPTGPPTDFVP